jgi:hypothetical protein
MRAIPEAMRGTHPEVRLRPNETEGTLGRSDRLVVRVRAPFTLLPGWLSKAVLPLFAVVLYLAMPEGEARAAPDLGQAVVATAVEDVLDVDTQCLVELFAFDGVAAQLGSHLNHDGSGRHSNACAGLRGIGFAFLGLAALVVIALGRMRHATEQQRLELARKLVEQGIEPPAELLGSAIRNDLRKGVVLLSAGVGLLIAAMVMGDHRLAPGGLIPGFIGLGYLVSYSIAKRSRG